MSLRKPQGSNVRLRSLADVPPDPRSILAGMAEQAFLHGANLTGQGDALTLYTASAPILEVYIERRPKCGLYA